MKRSIRALALAVAALVALPGAALAQGVPDVPDPGALVELIRGQLPGVPGTDLAGLFGEQIVIDTDHPADSALVTTLAEALAPIIGGTPVEIPGLGQFVPVHVLVSVQMIPLALTPTMPRLPDAGGVLDAAGSFDMPAIAAPADAVPADGVACSLVDEEIALPGGYMVRVCISVGGLVGDDLPMPGELPGLPGLPAAPELPDVPSLPGQGDSPIPPLPVDAVGHATDVIETVDGATGGTLSPVLDPVQDLLEDVGGLLGL